MRFTILSGSYKTSKGIQVAGEVIDVPESMKRFANLEPVIEQAPTPEPIPVILSEPAPVTLSKGRKAQRTTNET